MRGQYYLWDLPVSGMDLLWGWHPVLACSYTFSLETSSVPLLLYLWSLRRPAAELWSWDWLLPSSWLSSPSPSRVRSPISWILWHSFPQGCSSLVACLYLRVEAMPLHRDWQGKDWLHIMSQTLLSPCSLKAKLDLRGKKYKHTIINMEYRCDYSIQGTTGHKGRNNQLLLGSLLF